MTEVETHPTEYNPSSRRVRRMETVMSLKILWSTPDQNPFIVTLFQRFSSHMRSEELHATLMKYVHTSESSQIKITGALEALQEIPRL